jgi:ferredoxin/coenzyme F420-reducing hydrogenase delta subunit
MISRAAALLRAGVRAPLGAADALASRLYGWRHNPLYQSGTIAVVAFVAMLVSGLYLLLFYRIGSPYESVARLQGQVAAGRWLRALHRYAADLAVAAALVHALRMYAQGKSWGPRALAWVSGLTLLLLTFVCGWTGYVMVWDAQAQLLAVEGARILDVLPIFSEPLGRAFVGDRPLPGAFFFLNLFAHIALPIGLALGLWIHVSRVARPALLPPRWLLHATWIGLVAASLAVPAPLGPKADLRALLGPVDLDLFYAFWVPLSRRLPPGAVWLAVTGLALLLATAPLWSRPPAQARPAPSSVSPKLCTACQQCALDCPYEAIALLPLPEAPLGRAAVVDPGLCVSCGICAGSCAPMAIGPPGRTGREQLVAARSFLAERRPGPADVVLVACRGGAGGLAESRELEGAPVYPVGCAGSLHTSVIELLIRSGVGGVLIAACPPRDCRHREGPKWLEARLHAGREAELQERVDRRRLRVLHAGLGEARLVKRELADFRTDLASIGPIRGERDVEIDAECELPRAEAGA